MAASRRQCDLAAQEHDVVVKEGPTRTLTESSAASSSASEPEVLDANSEQLATNTVTDGDWLVVSQPVRHSKEDGSQALDAAIVEAKVEKLLTWMLTPAIHGISGLGVPGAVERAAEILAEHNQDVDAALREVVAGSERTVSKVVADFCIERIPVLGCPTVLMRSTFGNLRSILIIAALYGHNIEAARTQHEALLCLIPPGEDADDGFASLRCCHLDSSSLVSGTARKVARIMITGALRRATGLEAAVDYIELATLLYSSFGQDEAVDEDGFVHVMGTPASTARDYFRRRSLLSRLLLWCSLPMLVLGAAAPSLRHVPKVASNLLKIMLLLRRWLALLLPAVLLIALAFGVILYSCGRKTRLDARRRLHRIMHGQHAQALSDLWPRVVTMFVFTMHAALPAISTSSALGLILFEGTAKRASGTSADVEARDDWDLLHWVSCAMLGIFSLCSVMQGHLENESSHAGQDGVLMRICLRVLHLLRQVARFYCVFAAWMYASFLLDLGATSVLHHLEYMDDSGTALGFIGVVATVLGASNTNTSSNPLSSHRALTFSLSMISVASQQRLVEVLSRREVLLRLIGAERMMASTLCLVLKGVAVAAANAKNGTNPMNEFLLRVAPPQLFCVACVTLRQQAVIIGILAGMAPKLCEYSQSLNGAVTFAAGTLVGAYVARAVLRVWYACQEDLSSPALRLAWLLVPGHVSGRTKGLLRGVLASRGRRAVRLMAANIFQKAMRWWKWLRSRS